MESDLDPSGAPLFCGGVTVQLMPEVSLPPGTAPTSEEHLQAVLADAAETQKDGQSLLEQAATTTVCF